MAEKRYSLHIEKKSDPIAKVSHLIEAFITKTTDIKEIEQGLGRFLPAGYCCGRGGTHVWIHNQDKKRVAIIQ